MYYSNTKHKAMEVSEMHMMHLENVLLKDIKEGGLDWGDTNELTAEYIKKSKSDRERLHKMVKSSAGVNRLLLDLLMTDVTVSVPHKPVRQAVPRVNAQLEFFRKVALSYLQTHGRISADTLRQLLLQAGHSVNGQTLTHVFRDERFEQIGYRRSIHPGAKGRFINVWTAA